MAKSFGSKTFFVLDFAQHLSNLGSGSGLDSIRAFAVDHLNYFFTTARNCVVGLKRSDVSAATSGRHDDGGKIDHGVCQTRKKFLVAKTSTGLI